MIFLLLLVVIGVAIYFFLRKPALKLGNQHIIDDQYLEDHVLFYRQLPDAERVRFQDAMIYFLDHVKITGAGTEITNEIKLLIASGAVVPIFNFPGWHYNNLQEILVYGDAFNHDFETSGNNNRNIAGMVGTGYMEGKMILSRHSVLEAFKNETDKSNTIIHEFVHLLDKADGDIDGIPSVLLQRQYVIPWIDMIHKEVERIKSGKSDIDPYAYVNKQEFFAVASEYFFERPDLLQNKHPQLYEILREIFDGD